MLAYFVTGQSSDAGCRTAFTSGEKPNTRFNVYSDGALVRVSLLDGASQRFVLASLRPSLLHHCHYSLLTGHSNKGQMYDSMRNALYWHHMANDVHTTVRDCRACGQNRTHGRQQRQLKLFFFDGSLKYIRMDILRPLPKTKPGN